MDPVFRMGSSGDGVLQIQLALKKIGYPLKGTGYFGAATYTAVRDYQARKGLTVDGEVGVETANALLSVKDRADVAHPEEVERPIWLQAGMQWLGTKEQPGKGDNKVILNWAKGQGGE